MKCHEETEQAQQVKALEQVEAWDEPAGVAVLSLQASVDTAFAQAVVNGSPRA